MPYCANTSSAVRTQACVMIRVVYQVLYVAMLWFALLALLQRCKPLTMTSTRLAVHTAARMSYRTHIKADL
jgi:hypothetical protein